MKSFSKGFVTNSSSWASVYVEHFDRWEKPMNSPYRDLEGDTLRNRIQEDIYNILRIADDKKYAKAVSDKDKQKIAKILSETLTKESRLDQLLLFSISEKPNAKTEITINGKKVFECDGFIAWDTYCMDILKILVDLGYFICEGGFEVRQL
jgi:hypothetical protein